jgi:microcin C transport system substrate-binding protein
VTRVAYWDKFARPAIDPRYGLDLQTWWVDQVRADQVVSRQDDLDLEPVTE